jgi:glycosyltransferase involved in cell wall biosynthesis
VVVYCRNENQSLTEHLGMELVNLPALRQKHAETLSHTALSVLHQSAHRCDVVLLFNAANAPLLPVLHARGLPVALHVDGLEWKRGKWSGAGRRYYEWAEGVGVRSADRLIADAKAIQAYYRHRYGVESEFIPYGAPIHTDRSSGHIGELGLPSDGYHLVVARMEPENNLDVIVRGYVEAEPRLPLVVVGSAPHAAGYAATLRSLANGSDVRFMGSVWDQDLLDQLYCNARLYLHGHSVGGTNPSLLRAMGAGAPVAAYDVVFNREVLADAGAYFVDGGELSAHIRAAEEDPQSARARGRAGQERAAANYDWDRVTDQYERLCAELIGKALPGAEGTAHSSEQGRPLMHAER